MSRENKRRGTNRRESQNPNAVGAAERRGRSNHQEQTPGRPSHPQEIIRNPDIESQHERKPGQESKLSPRDTERNFDILVDNVPYIVKATRFRFNGEVRYKVSFNGSSEHVFTWDSSLGKLRAIDDEASTMPDNLEMAISEKLQSGL